MNIDKLQAGPELDALVAEKVCSTCGISKPTSDFTKCSRAVDGLQWDCRVCYRQQARKYYLSDKGKKKRAEWYQKNKAKVSALRKARGTSRSPAFKEYRRKWALRTRYGITLEEYERLVEAQSGACAICSAKHSKERPLNVDHCHSTGKIRGLLCASCNPGLANFRDNPKALEKAADYIRAALKAVGA